MRSYTSSLPLYIQHFIHQRQLTMSRNLDIHQSCNYQMMAPVTSQGLVGREGALVALVWCASVPTCKSRPAVNRSVGVGRVGTVVVHEHLTMILVRTFDLFIHRSVTSSLKISTLLDEYTMLAPSMGTCHLPQKSCHNRQR